MSINSKAGASLVYTPTSKEASVGGLSEQTGEYKERRPSCWGCLGHRQDLGFDSKRHKKRAVSEGVTLLTLKKVQSGV